MSLTHRFISKELRFLKKHQLSNVALIPDPSNLHEWLALFEAAPDSPYAGTTLALSFILPDDYPFQPPKICFISKIYHPNVSEGGDICMDILESHWSPVWTLTTIILAIISLLDDPNPDTPMNAESAELFIRDRKSYNEKARQWIRQAGVGVRLKNLNGSQLGLPTRESSTAYEGSDSLLRSGIYIYSCPVRVSPRTEWLIASRALCNQSQTCMISDWCHRHPVRVFKDISTISGLPWYHWGVWVSGALFELGICSRTRKIQLRIQKYHSAPGGNYFQIFTHLAKQTDLDAVKVAAEACMGTMQEKYNLLDNNCQHFAISFIEMLIKRYGSEQKDRTYSYEVLSENMAQYEQTLRTGTQVMDTMDLQQKTLRGWLMRKSPLGALSRLCEALDLAS